MIDFYNKHYITLNDKNQITSGFSDVFRQPTASDICINEKGSYQFRLIVDGELTEENPPLFDGMTMIPLYKYENSKVVPRTEEELEKDREEWRKEQERQAALPTREDKIEAQTTYTAMMTDTLLED